MGKPKFGDSYAFWPWGSQKLTRVTQFGHEEAKKRRQLRILGTWKPQNLVKYDTTPPQNSQMLPAPALGLYILDNQAWPRIADLIINCNKMNRQ